MSTVALDTKDCSIPFAVIYSYKFWQMSYVFETDDYKRS